MAAFIVTCLCAIVVFLVNVVGNLLAADIAQCSPHWAEKIVRRAARKLPRSIRERLTEEWLAEVHHVPGDVSKLLFAIPLLWTARQLASTTSRGDWRVALRRFAWWLADDVVRTYADVPWSRAFPVSLALVPVICYGWDLVLGGSDFVITTVWSIGVFNLGLFYCKRNARSLRARIERAAKRSLNR